ncbi:hypothetical protein R83H12_01663 [Fibrobacteria bacterium R8-3-H12]
MINDFVIDEQKLKQLATEFGIKKDTCKGLFNLYENSVSKSIRAQYLAHIIRSLELSMREMTGNKLFVINCVPMPKESIIRNAQGRYNSGRFFIIYFNKDLPEPERRNAIAHELGHLFMVAFANHQFKGKVQSKKMYGDGNKMEPLASLFGFFAISAKNQFYQNDAPTYMKNIATKGWSGLLNDFLNLSKSP